jgi:hypothetical protein
MFTVANLVFSKSIFNNNNKNSLDYLIYYEKNVMA